MNGVWGAHFHLPAELAAPAATADRLAVTLRGIAGTPLPPGVPVPP